MPDPNNPYNYNPWTGGYSYTDASGQTSFGTTGGGALGGLPSLAAGISGLVGSKSRIDNWQTAYNTAKSNIEDWYNAAGNKYKASVTPRAYDVLDMSKRRTDLTPIQANQAQLLNTLGQAGGRELLAYAGQAVDPSQELAVKQADLDRDIAATREMAGLEASIAGQNLGWEQQLGLRQLGYEEAAAQQAALNKAQAEADRRDAWGQIAQGVLQTGLSFVNPFAGMKDGGRIPSYENGGRMYNMGGSVLEQLLAGGAGGGGGLPPVQGPLPGEASHETNPMHIVDKNGVKRGEAMGGEFVINNDQASEMTDEYKEIKAKLDAGETISEEEWMELFKTIDGIFGQPQFDDSEMFEEPMA